MMRILLLFICMYSQLMSVESILMKFRAGSSEFQNWKKNDRMGDIPALQTVIGKHDSKPYVREELITMLLKKKSETLLSSSHGLERIAILEFQTDIPIEKAVRALSSLPFIEYAEVMPKHRFTQIPNDPLYGYQYHQKMIGIDSAWVYYEAQAQADSVLIGIIDTGVDPLHEDLSEVMYVNPGESGLDSIGNSKSANGIDDDKNGFIDDWQGWDFASSIDPIKGDNRAVPGHLHGTHVAGIACAMTNNGKGIAGIARNHRILPVKVGYDDSASVNVSGSYEGILYAALMGADVINCSWGSPTSSMAEQEIINEALQYGSIIVGGAGNDRSDMAFYPASYRGVISVAALEPDTVKASYSNVHGTVDISAPGSFIYSTVLGNSYGYSSGTSMAAPIVSGIAALVKSLNPHYSNEQVSGIVKASALDISSYNPFDAKGLGAGLIQAHSALNMKNPLYVEITQTQFSEVISDGMFTPGERIELSIVLHNLLEEVDSCKVIIHSEDAQYPVSILKDTLSLGSLKASTIYAIAEKIPCILPQNSPFNHRIALRLDIESLSKNIGRGFAELIINPTYRSMTSNDMHTSVSSQGHIGYNDYPTNLQGIGLSIPPHEQSVLFESGFIVGTSAEKLSNGVRDISGDQQELSFYIRSSVDVVSPGPKADAESYAEFSDSARVIDAGVSVKHHVYQFDEVGIDSTIFITFDIRNERTFRMDSLHAGMFFDWDIGPNGQNNICAFEQDEGYAHCFSTVDSTLPHIGVTLLHDMPVQFHAIDNDGRGNGFSIYDGFSRNEKWFAISGGISREMSRSTDASMVMGGGPFTLDPGARKQVALAIVAGTSKAGIKKAVINARQAAAQKGIASGFVWNQYPEQSRLLDIVISQDEMIRIDFELSEQDLVEFSIYSMQGQLLRALSPSMYDAGQYAGTFMSFEGLPSGVYFLRMKLMGSQDALPFIIVR
ncbi:MAG: S8 family peptidase [Candidatus Kapaibacteriota bacterium]